MDTKVALVTGSTSGIGLATARRLSADGYAVVLHSRSSENEGLKRAAELPQASYQRADLSRFAEIPLLIERILSDYGRLDVLINNAAMTRVVPHSHLRQADAELWRTMHDINVIAPWLLITEAEDALRAAGEDGTPGCVVNISSHAGVRPKGASIPYAVSKASLNHMTKLLAASLSPEIRFNAVAPGLVDTPMSEAWHDARELWQSRAPMKRQACPEDIAQIVSSLVASSYLTGEVVLADGGMNLT